MYTDKKHLALGKTGVLVNFIIQKFCKTAPLFCLSVSLVRDNLRGLRGNLKHKTGPLGSLSTPKHTLCQFIQV
jgi:hypothetical protein